MNSQQLTAAIKVLIAARDAGVNAQSVIDSLFEQWEAANAAALAMPHPDHVAHAYTVAKTF